MRVRSVDIAVIVGSALCAVSVLLGGTMGDALAGLVVLVALGAAFVRLSRVELSSSWRLIILGAALIGVGPVLSVTLGGASLTWGDLAAFTGYLLIAFGLERVLYARTQRLQVDVLLDAALLVGWTALVIVLVLYDVVADASGGTETALAFRYLPFTLLVTFQGLRLVLGSPERSKGFVWLSVGIGSAFLSEVAFLVEEAGLRPTRSLGVGLASFAILCVAVAAADDSAKRLEQPREGDYRRTEGLRDGLHLGSLFVLLVGVAVFRQSANVVWVFAAALALLSCVRIYVLFRERRRWLEQERAMQSLSADLLEAEDSVAVLSRARDTLLEMLGPRRLLEVEFYERQAPGEWDIVGGSTALQPFGSEEFDRVLASQRSQVQRLRVGDGRRWLSRLVDPCSGALDERGFVVCAEGLPVFTEVEVSQIESASKTVRLALDALSARELAHRQRADRRFRALSQDSNDIVALVSEFSFEVEMLGPTLGRLLGQSDDAMFGHSPLSLVHPEDRAPLEYQLEDSGGDSFELPAQDVRLRHINGRYHWFTLTVRDLRDDSEVSGLLFSFRDVHDRKMAELQVRESESRYRALVQNASDVFVIVDRHQLITYISPNVNRVLGFAPGDLIGTDARGLLTPMGAVAVDQAIRDQKIDSGESFTAELRTSGDDLRFVELRFAATLIDDEPGYMITAQDITDQRNLELSLREQALSDPLTGLLNRAAIMPELQKSFQTASETSLVGLLHLDIADFSELNSTVGFDQGDVILREVAERLRSRARADDLVARLDGDEYLVVVRGARSVGAILDVAASIVEIFDEPFTIGDRPLTMSAVVGVVTSSSRRASAVHMAENASLAARHGKTHGGRVTLYDEAMRSAARERFELAADLRDRVDTDEFSLVYQPLFDLAANKVTSVEALLRWNHPARGHISPSVFIPLAEDTGSVIELGRMVMRRACAQLVEWRDTLPGGEYLSVAVNVSARQLEPTGEGDKLRELIRESGVDPRRVTLELTESTMIEDAAWLREQLTAFKEIGCRIAVDDFGAGSAGLAHLRDVPFDILKIDKAYIADLESSREAFNLVAGVIELAHGLDARIVAEGIETPAQMTMLQELGCDYGQGFFLGRPMDPFALENWIGQGWVGAAAAVILDRDLPGAAAGVEL